MSDCYLGMDQQYSVCLDVQEADISAQFNTEVVFEDGELDGYLDEEHNGLDASWASRIPPDSDS